MDEKLALLMLCDLCSKTNGLRLFITVCGVAVVIFPTNRPSVIPPNHMLVLAHVSSTPFFPYIVADLHFSARKILPAVQKDADRHLASRFRMASARVEAYVFHDASENAARHNEVRWALECKKDRRLTSLSHF